MKFITLLFGILLTTQAFAVTYDFTCSFVGLEEYKDDKIFLTSDSSRSSVQFRYKKSNMKDSQLLPRCPFTRDVSRGYSYYLRWLSADCGDIVNLYIETDLSKGENFNFSGNINFPDGLLEYPKDRDLKINCIMEKNE